MANTYNIEAKRNVGKITKGLKIQMSSPHPPGTKVIVEAYEKQFGLKATSAGLGDFIIEKVK